MTVWMRRAAQAVSAYALLAVVALSLALYRGAFSEWIVLNGTGDAAASAALGDGAGAELA